MRLDTVRRQSRRIDPACAALLAGCASVGPAAEQLYPAHAASDERVPVILIPGLLGSRLAHAGDGVEAWPGGTRKLLTSDYAELALRIDPETLEPLDDGLVPSGIFEGAAGRDFYRGSCASCARPAATGSRAPAARSCSSARASTTSPTTGARTS